MSEDKKILWRVFFYTAAGAFTGSMLWTVLKLAAMHAPAGCP